VPEHGPGDHRGAADAIFDAVLAPERGRRSVSARQIAARGTMGVADVLGLVRAFGLPEPAPDEPFWTPEEAAAIAALASAPDLWPREAYLQVSREYGRALREVAAIEARLSRRQAEPVLDADAATQAERVRAAFAELLPLGETLLLAVHRRMLEHAVAQVAVSELESEAPSGLVEARPVTLAFCDLAGFTRYTDRQGDRAAMQAVERFLAVVDEHCAAGRVVKGLGDGVLLAFDEPAAAVDATVRIVRDVRGQEGPGVHASIHRGAAIERGGDYFGAAVNVASRLLAVAREDEIAATESVVDRCPGLAWSAGEPLRLPGVGAPVAVRRLRP
jgi:adenylate cyclase